jgi:hypothetical protein
MREIYQIFKLELVPSWTNFFLRNGAQIRWHGGCTEPSQDSTGIGRGGRSRKFESRIGMGENMKNIITAVAVFFGMNTFASTTGVQANLFNCTGESNTKVTFSSTSMLGTPQMSVNFRGDQAQSQSKVQVQQTQVGRLVTVQDNHMTTLDGPSMRYTMIVPQVVLDSDSHSENVSTLLIKTSIANPFFHPASVQIIENNEFVPVECVAEHVIF